MSHFTSLLFTSFHFTSLHLSSLLFTSLLFNSLHFTSLLFSSLQFSSFHFSSLHFSSLHFSFLSFYSFFHWNIVNWDQTKKMKERKNTFRGVFVWKNTGSSICPSVCRYLYIAQDRIGQDRTDNTVKHAFLKQHYYLPQLRPSSDMSHAMLFHSRQQSITKYLRLSKIA